MKKIAILGCTGSIGTQTLDIVRNSRDEFKIVGLSCNSDVKALAEYAKEFDCKTLGVYDKSKIKELNEFIPGADIYGGDGALTDVAADADTVVSAVVGMIGLKAVISALIQGKTVALANKESLVAGGEIVTKMLKRGGKICPVDSEHSAVWQCLRGERNFKRIILTASGGPFYFSDTALDGVTPEMAVKHPNWNMGKKISVDSATMMNKSLEIIEARWLFDTLNIDYVIHPESIVHSMVEFDDGSIKAQVGFPDMRLPIRYAMTYPEHGERDFTPLKLPLELRFYAPDETRFPAPKLARQVIRAGGNSGAILNAANEAAVRLFLERKIRFTDIVRIVENTLDTETQANDITEDNIFETHNRIYDKIYLKYRGR